MKGLMLRWCISAISLFLTASLLAGIQIGGFLQAFAAAAVLGILNAIIRPVLLILTFPITILTLGLFTLVINGLLLYAASSVIKGIEIVGFGWAVLGAFILGVINWALNSLINDRAEVRVIDLKRREDGIWRAR